MILLSNEFRTSRMRYHLLNVNKIYSCKKYFTLECVDYRQQEVFSECNIFVVLLRKCHAESIQQLLISLRMDF